MNTPVEFVAGYGDHKLLRRQTWTSMWHPVEVKASCLDVVALKAGTYVQLSVLINTSALARMLVIPLLASN